MREFNHKSMHANHNDSFSFKRTVDKSLQFFSSTETKDSGFFLNLRRSNYLENYLFSNETQLDWVIKAKTDV